MPEDVRTRITLLLDRLGEGDEEAMPLLLPLVYEELRAIARRYVRSESDTVNPTALVHEAYLRLVGQPDTDWKGRQHFLAVCSVVMRNLVVDFARRRKAAKRGGDAQRVDLESPELRIESGIEELLALDEALDRLKDFDPALCRVVECRYFAGLTEAETAQVLAVSERSVRRYWIKAKALLQTMLSGDGGARAGEGPRS